MEDNIRKEMCVHIYTYAHGWVTAVQQKLAQHCKSTIILKKGYHPKYHHFEGGISVYEFGEDTSIPTIMREGPWSTEGAGHSSLFLEAVQASLLPGAPHQLSQQISYINSSQAILGNP